MMGEVCGWKETEYKRAVGAFFLSLQHQLILEQYHVGSRGVHLHSPSSLNYHICGLHESAVTWDVFMLTPEKQVHKKGLRIPWPSWNFLVIWVPQ